MNDRITAAAPEMYEACLAALKYIERLTGRVISRDYEKSVWGGIVVGKDLDALFDDWAAKTTLAVAKARGNT